MARIKLILPDSYSFSTQISVRITDVNYGGHLGNDAILSIIHEARMRFLKKRGYTEMDCSGVGLIMSDVAIEFKKEAFYGDVIEIAMTAQDFSRAGFDVFYKLTHKDTGAVIAIAKTGMVCYNYESKKISGVPEELKQRLSAPL